jgi:hypothetical protein
MFLLQLSLIEVAAPVCACRRRMRMDVVRVTDSRARPPPGCFATDIPQERRCSDDAL